MKNKILSAFVLAALTVIYLPLAQAYSQESTQEYLENHANNPWSTMALASLGSPPVPTDHLKNPNTDSAISLSAPILGITSLGFDPRSFGQTDLVGALLSYHAGGQIGDPAIINDDIFAVLALVSAGVSRNDSAIQDAKQEILAAQNDDGGWGFVIGGGSDTNITASALLALKALDEHSASAPVVTGLAYLQNSQNDDGGFPYDPDSAFDTSSDSSSTAWVIWALNALGIDPASWNKPGGDPITYLESLQNGQGYFGYQSADEQANGFTPITTAYAAIALSGKYLPVNIISTLLQNPPQQNPQPGQFSVRIEGSSSTVCDTFAVGPTALDVVKNSSDDCGFQYTITDTSFGPYLSAINSDAAAGFKGWMYLVNWQSPSVGAADYRLLEDDEVLWFYGEFTDLPLRLTLLDTQVENDSSAQAKVEYLQNGGWSALEGAIIRAGNRTFNTGAGGAASFRLEEGVYRIFAEKPGYVRSNSESLLVGDPDQTSVALTAEIISSSVGAETVSYIIEPGQIDFGQINAGSSKTRDLTIRSTGTVGIHVEAEVAGDEVFRDYLRIDQNDWRDFYSNIEKNGASEHQASLVVPSSYSGTSGPKSGTLTFWAQAQ